MGDIQMFKELLLNQYANGGKVDSNNKEPSLDKYIENIKRIIEEEKEKYANASTPQPQNTTPQTPQNAKPIRDLGIVDLDSLKTLIAEDWPATSKVQYNLQPQDNLVRFYDSNNIPRGTIETIIPNQIAARYSPFYSKSNIPAEQWPLLEEVNRVDYRLFDLNGNPIGDKLLGINYLQSNYPGENTVIYNPNHTTTEDIKLDLLHVLQDDDKYANLYGAYMTAAINNPDFLYHDIDPNSKQEIEDLLQGNLIGDSKENISRALNAESILLSLLDGYLRDLFYQGTPEQRVQAGYTENPYTIQDTVIQKAVNNIHDYLRKKALGGPLYIANNPIESFRGKINIPEVRY